MSVFINEESALWANVAVTMNSQETDALLVDAARRRDPEAFEEIMTIYGPRIFRLAERITRNREDTEDVSQDSFARAFLHMDTFRGDSRFSTWLTRIAINESLMKLRTRRCREVHFDRTDTDEDTPFCAEVTDGSPTPEQRYSRKELQRILASAISELPRTFREVLHLRELEEHSIEETARKLGLSISAVKSRAIRGRQKLRQALTKYLRRGDLVDFAGRYSV